MKKFDFFREKITGYKPKTPFAAIKAYEAGYLPLEHFISMSTSTKSLDIKSFRMEELERLLARENLTIEINYLLANILESLLQHTDAEIALFAAESLNLMESRYIDKIENLKEKIEKNPENIHLSQLSRLYIELALLNDRRKNIQDFYLMEAYTLLKKIIDTKQYKIDDIRMLIKILIIFKLYDQAIFFLDELDIEEEYSLLIMRAKIEFQKRNYFEVSKIMEKLSQFEDQLKENEKEILSYWLKRPYDKTIEKKQIDPLDNIILL